uniref:Uncharacterized protein n=1 Tax=Cannabis sativa TaxID=3483 RepID=A0A803PBD0_CANSA
MALIMEPWHFQNHHIVLREPCALQEVTEDSLHQSPFWIQLHRLPFLSKSKAIAMWAGNIVGSYLDVDEDSLNEGKMARIRDSRDEFWVEFRYERLPEFCFECGIIGHPFEHCPKFLDQLYNGQEPSLEYGPERMGAPLPSSGYDRYRTDFFKGNAWPLMTRLARKSFAAVLPRLDDRPNPHPYNLTVTESSSPPAMNPPHQSSYTTYSASSHNTSHDPSVIPFPSYLPISLPSSATNSPPSFATYPPQTNLHYSPHPTINSSSMKQKAIMTDSIANSIPFSDITNTMSHNIGFFTNNIASQSVDGSSLGQFSASKRPIESESLRKFLKRCRSQNNGQLVPPATTDLSSASVLSGSGADVCCNSQPWIPGSSNFKPLLFLSNDHDVKVADFITHSRLWDVPKLQQFFSPPDVDRILSIPLSLFPCDDVLLWHYTSTSLYTYFWGLKLPSKIRIFAWRAYHEALPTAATLQHRHISSTPQCPLCQMHLETINHVFFWCNRARQVWRNWESNINWHLSKTCSFSDFLVYVSSLLQSDKVELFITILWCIWKARNADTHSKTPKSAMQIWQFANNYIAEYKKAQSSHHHTILSFNGSPADAQNITAPTGASSQPLSAAFSPEPLPHDFVPQSRVSPAKPKWLARPSGRLKLNTDAAVNVNTGIFRLAAILRDSNGDILAAMVEPMKGCVKTEEMEALAVAWSLKLLLTLRLSVDFVETDSLLVVNGLKSQSKGLSSFYVILNDITFLLSNFPRAQISHVYRSANNKAHLLAKFALTVDSDCTWLEEVPPPLRTVM